MSHNVCEESKVNAWFIVVKDRRRAKQPKDHNHGELFNGMGWLGLLQMGWRLPSSPGGWGVLVFSFSSILLL